MVNFSGKDQINVPLVQFKQIKMITAFWRQHFEKKKIVTSCLHFLRLVIFFFLLIFQNQSAAGGVIQQIKIKEA